MLLVCVGVVGIFDPIVVGIVTLDAIFCILVFELNEKFGIVFSFAPDDDRVTVGGTAAFNKLTIGFDGLAFRHSRISANVCDDSKKSFGLFETVRTGSNGGLK